LSQELLIECIAKLLNGLNATAESLPTVLPPNTGVKFRICSKFAAAVKVKLDYIIDFNFNTNFFKF
jgi:hypothetical protein